MLEWYHPRYHMVKGNKLIVAMRRNPRGDWRIEQLKAIADRLGIPYRAPGGSHVVFAPIGKPILTVPERRPIKPVYIRRFVAMIEGHDEEERN